MQILLNYSQLPNTKDMHVFVNFSWINNIIVFLKKRQRKRERGKGLDRENLCLDFVFGMLGVKILHAFQEIRIGLHHCMSHETC
jgi:hypothetical protein